MKHFSIHWTALAPRHTINMLTISFSWVQGRVYTIKGIFNTPRECSLFMEAGHEDKLFGHWNKSVLNQFEKWKCLQERTKKCISEIYALLSRIYVKYTDIHLNAFATLIGFIIVIIQVMQQKFNVLSIQHIYRPLTFCTK